MNGWYAIIWTNADTIYWSIYAPLGGAELRCGLYWMFDGTSNYWLPELQPNWLYSHHHVYHVYNIRCGYGDNHVNVWLIYVTGRLIPIDKMNRYHVLVIWIMWSVSYAVHSFNWIVYLKPLSSKPISTVGHVLCTEWYPPNHQWIETWCTAWL